MEAYETCIVELRKVESRRRKTSLKNQKFQGARFSKAVTTKLKGNEVYAH
jgi:hypothetical protein